MSEPTLDPQPGSEATPSGEGPLTSAPQSVWEQLIGVFTEPSEVFKRLRLAPSWVGAFLLTLGLGLASTLIWAHKVDQEATVRNNMQVVADVFHVPHNEAALQKQLDAVSGQPYVRSALGLLLGAPLVYLIFSAILTAFARIGGTDDAVGFEHAWSVAWVHNLATTPTVLLAGLMCILRPVGGASSYAQLSPTNPLFFIRPESAVLRGLLFLGEPFYLFSFVALALACKHTLKLRTWATVTALVFFGFFGLLFHFLAGIF